MSENVIQASFSGGEYASSMLARTDLAKYRTGARLMRNWFVDYRSGASTCPGTEFIIQAYSSDKRVRLVEFQYSVEDTYVLEFGDEYVRFITAGGSVLEADFNIADANNSTPGVIEAPGHNFINDDWVFVQNIVGATGYNGRFYTVTVSGDFLTLYDVNGNAIDATGFGTYLSGGTVARVYKITSPYPAEDLDGLKFTQSASVLTITHPDYPPYNLLRTAPTSWAFDQIDFETSAEIPTTVLVTGSAAGAANYSYMVTSLDADGQESEPSVAGVGAALVNNSVTAGTIYVRWTAAAGAVSYNIYKSQLSITTAVPAGVAHGYVGNVTGVAFDDSNIVPDFSVTPPIANDPFDASNYPSVTGYHQQRQVYASPDDNPLTFYMSQPGAFNNFNYSHPIQEDDYIEGTLVSGQVNKINSMISMPGGLILLTSKGAWQVTGDSQDAKITPINVTAIPQAFNGASDLRPLVVNNNILFVQELGATVRDLAYSFNTNIYTGMDISVLANHLFFGYTITEWAYAEEPWKLVHAIRSDGLMLVLTYVKEQEMYGWGHRDTLGEFKSVASIVEGEFHATYVLVKRLIQGEWRQMIERIAEREFPYGAEDCWAVDCGVRSTLPTPAAGLVASAITGSVTFTADAPVFTSADVGSVLRMGGGIANITTFTSTTQITGTFVRNIQDILPNSDDVPLPAESGEWSLTDPATVFTGLDHLIGQTVSINADGGVVAPQVVAADGSITLANPATKVTAGLGYTCQLQTMPLDVGEPTIQGKRKKINALTMRCANTRGLYAGSTFDTLRPNKELERDVPLGQPPALITGDARMIMDPSWSVPGQICMQVTDPLCATILGVIPEITVGDTVK